MDVAIKRLVLQHVAGPEVGWLKYCIPLWVGGGAGLLWGP